MNIWYICIKEENKSLVCNTEIQFFSHVSTVAQTLLSYYFPVFYDVIVVTIYLVLYPKCFTSCSLTIILTTIIGNSRKFE